MKTKEEEQEERDAKFLAEREHAAKYFNIPLETVLWYHGGVCYDRIGVTTKESADAVTKHVEGKTVNGGMYDGMSLGNQTHYKHHHPPYFDVMC